MKFRDMPYKRPDLETLRGAYASLTERFPKAASADEQYALIEACSAGPRSPSTRF